MTIAPGVLPNEGIGLASKLTILLPDPPVPEASASARDAASAACLACFEACRALADAWAADSDACDAFSTAICTSLADFL